MERRKEPGERIYAIRHAVVWAVANMESRLAAADSAALKLAAAKAMLELAGELK